MHSVKIKNRKLTSGFSLVEILIALALFSIVVISVALFASESYRSTRNSELKLKAKLYLEEVQNAVLVSKSDSWSSIMEIADGNPKHVVYSGSTYTFADGVEVKDGVTYSFSVGSVFRDLDGNIVLVGGTEDHHSKSIVVTATWNDLFGVPVTVMSTMYINDWNTARWVDTTEVDFLAGVMTDTVVVNNNGGEVQLEGLRYGDWCNPALTLSSADLPGQGVAESIWTESGEVFAGTGQNASGLSFIDILVDESEPPIVTVTGTLDGYKTNNVHGSGDYAYIATDTNDREIAIIDLTTTPFSVSGYFNAPGNGDGDSVFISGSYGFAAVGSKLYAFDLTSKTGSRPQVGSAVTLAGTGENIDIVGDYAYVATASSTTQLQIVNISAPASMSIVGSASVNGENGRDVFVDQTDNHAYVATASSTSKAELFIVDVSSPMGSRPTLASYDTSGMDPKGVVVVEGDRAIIVGSSGEEYQVLDIEDIYNLSKCGGLNVDTGVFHVNAAKNSRGDAYSYIVTGDSADEFKMIKGGAGGGGVGGYGYVTAGSFESRVFDTGAIGSNFFFIEWQETLNTATDITLQVRSGDSPDLSMESWVGPDGTSGSYFTINTGEILPAVLRGHQYFQYKVYMTSDSVNTPEYFELQLTYQS